MKKNYDAIGRHSASILCLPVSKADDTIDIVFDNAYAPSEFKDSDQVYKRITLILSTKLLNVLAGKIKVFQDLMLQSMLFSLVLPMP